MITKEDQGEPTKQNLRQECWCCGRKIAPDKAPRALCSDCAYGGYFGGS